MYTLFAYQKMVDKKDKSGKFPKDKASFDGVSFDIHYTKECKAKLVAEMLAKNIKFPINITLDKNQYFTKQQRYTRNDNTSGEKSIIIVKDYTSIEQAEFKEQASLKDLADAIKAGREAMAETDTDSEF